MIDFQNIGNLWRCPDCGWLWESTASRCERCTAASLPSAPAITAGNPVNQKALQNASSPLTPTKAMRESPPGQSARGMRNSPHAASLVVEQSFAQLPPQSDGVQFGKLLTSDSALPNGSIFPDEGEDRPLSSAHFGSDRSEVGSPWTRSVNSRPPASAPPHHHRRKRDDCVVTPPRPRSELGRMVIPEEEGNTYMQKSTSEFALNSSGRLKHQRNMSVGSSSSRSLPGESGRDNGLNSSDGFKQRKMQSPESGRRPPSSRAMPGEEVLFASPSTHGGRGYSRSSRSRPGDELRTAATPMSEMFPASSGTTTPVRMASHSRSNEQQKRIYSSSGTGRGSGTARSLGFSETQRSIQVSESGSTWTKTGEAGNSWQKPEPESRLEFVVPTPGKWIQTHPVADRPPWTMSNIRTKPGGPLYMAGGMAIGSF